MKTGIGIRTPWCLTGALGFIVGECADEKEGLLGAEETLPVWEFQQQLMGGLGFLRMEDAEVMASMLLDLGVITLASELVDNYDVQIHPYRAQKILNTLTEWQ